MRAVAIVSARRQTKSAEYFVANNYYEGMFLLDSADYASDPDGMSQMVTSAVEKASGTVEAHRPWQEGRLAYEIDGRRKGLHYLVMFRMDSGRMDDLHLICRRNDKILRTLFLAQPKIVYEDTVRVMQPHEEEDESGEAGGERPAEATVEAGAE